MFLASGPPMHDADKEMLVIRTTCKTWTLELYAFKSKHPMSNNSYVLDVRHSALPSVRSGERIRKRACDDLIQCMTYCTYAYAYASMLSNSPSAYLTRLMFNSKPYSMAVSVPEAIGGQDESVLEFSSQIPSQAKTVPRDERTKSAHNVCERVNDILFYERTGTERQGKC